MYTEGDELSYFRVYNLMEVPYGFWFANTFLLMLLPGSTPYLAFGGLILKSYQIATCWQLSASHRSQLIQPISLLIDSKVCVLISLCRILPQLGNQHNWMFVASSPASHCCSKAVPLPNGQLLTCGATENRSARRQTESAQGGKVGQQRSLRPWNLEWDQHFPSCDVRKKCRAAGIPCENGGQGVDQSVWNKSKNMFLQCVVFPPSHCALVI